MKERKMKGRKMERREMEKGGALTGGQAACFASTLYMNAGHDSIKYSLIAVNLGDKHPSIVLSVDGPTAPNWIYLYVIFPVDF